MQQSESWKYQSNQHNCHSWIQWIFILGTTRYGLHCPHLYSQCCWCGLLTLLWGRWISLWLLPWGSRESWIAKVWKDPLFICSWETCLKWLCLRRQKQRRTWRLATMILYLMFNLFMSRTSKLMACFSLSSKFSSLSILLGIFIFFVSCNYDQGFQYSLLISRIRFW